MFNWRTNSLVLLLIAFSGFDLILSDCVAAVAGSCSNQRDLNRFENWKYRKDLELSADFTRRDDRVINRDERHFNSKHRRSTIADIEIIHKEITDAKFPLSHERSHLDFERSAIRVQNRMDRIDHRRVHSKRREPKANRLEARMERIDQPGMSSEKREPNADRLDASMYRSDQRRINSERREPNLNRFVAHMSWADQMNPKRHDHYADRLAARMGRSDQRRMDSERRQSNIKGNENRVERADVLRAYSRVRNAKANHDNRSDRVDILLGQVSLLGAKSTDAIWTWNIIQFALIGLIISKMLKNDECSKYERSFLKTNAEKAVKAFDVIHQHKRNIALFLTNRISA